VHKAIPKAHATDRAITVTARELTHPGITESSHARKNLTPEERRAAPPIHKPPAKPYPRGGHAAPPVAQPSLGHRHADQPRPPKETAAPTSIAPRPRTGAGIVGRKGRNQRERKEDRGAYRRHAAILPLLLGEERLEERRRRDAPRGGRGIGLDGLID
jgi:hypothetical protein